MFSQLVGTGSVPPPKGECQDVQVAAARQSAATVLRTVQLYRAVDVVVVVCIMINFARSTSQMFQISPQWVNQMVLCGFL